MVGVPCLFALTILGYGFYNQFVVYGWQKTLIVIGSALVVTLASGLIIIWGMDLIE